MLHKRNVPANDKPADKLSSKQRQLAGLQKNMGKGRSAGSQNKRIRALKQIADRAALAGITPLEIMLDTARHLYHSAMGATRIYRGKTIKYIDEEKLQLAASVAKDAAPYVHPRLSSVEVIKNMSDDDLDTIIATAAAQAGLVIDMKAEHVKDVTPPKLEEKTP